MRLKNWLVIGENRGRTKQRIAAMRRLGYNIDVLTTTLNNIQPGINEQIELMDRVWNKLGLPRDKTQLNTRVVQQLAQKKYGLLWVEKSLLLKSTTLQNIKNHHTQLKMIWYSEDDMFARHNQSRYFINAISYYDIIFTTKSYNCHSNELPALGAKKVVFVEKSYDPELHKPISLSEKDKKEYSANVGFIGTFEQDRFEKMLFLAKNNIPVRVWGNGWRHVVNVHPNLNIENKPIYDEDYVKAIQATKINLCFLRKINRDLQTDRSVEIPACGAFMLAEKTSEHLKLFEENKEAVYFDIHDQNELYQKIIYYLSHENERNNIAAAGYQRCVRSAYSHDDRIKQMLQYVASLS